MFTSFNEKQERYSTPRSSSPSPTHNSTSTFNEVNKPQLSSPSDVVKENIGHIIFTENGGSILPADATIPGPYPTPPPPPPPPPPTSYSFILSFTNTLGENETQACLLGIAGSAQSTYYSSVATLIVNSVLYTDSNLSTTAPNGYYSDGTTNYRINGNNGTVISKGNCCVTYRLTTNRIAEQNYTAYDCMGNYIDSSMSVSDSPLDTCLITGSFSTTDTITSTIIADTCTL